MLSVQANEIPEDFQNKVTSYFWEKMLKAERQHGPIKTEPDSVRQSSVSDSVRRSESALPQPSGHSHEHTNFSAVSIPLTFHIANISIFDAATQTKVKSATRRDTDGRVWKSYTDVSGFVFRHYSTAY